MRGPAMRTLILFALAAALTACDDSTSIEAVLGPSALSGSGSGVGTGGTGGGLTIAVGRGQAAPLVGSWTRIASDGGVLTEQTWTFAADGSGTRTTTVRTLLGVPLTVEQQAFAWDAGAGVLLLRFDRTGVGSTVRASYAVLVGVTGTVLRLDGRDYARTSG